MQRRMWALIVSGLVTSICAFGGTADLDWGGFENNQGTYTYNGGAALSAGSELHASGILVDTVIGQNGVVGRYFTQASLKFDSGLYAGSGTWGGPGDLKLVGCILIGISNTCGYGTTATTVLVDDTFTSVGITQKGDFVFGQLAGTFDPTVSALFGIGQTFLTSLNGLNIAVSNLPADGVQFPTGAGRLQTQSGDLVTNTTAAAVPEDWSVFSTAGIFAFSLAVFVGARRFGVIKSVAF